MPLRHRLFVLITVLSSGCASVLGIPDLYTDGGGLDAPPTPETGPLDGQADGALIGSGDGARPSGDDAGSMGDEASMDIPESSAPPLEAAPDANANASSDANSPVGSTAPPCATSIGVGANRDVWITGCGPGPDFAVYRLDGATWVEIPSRRAAEVAVSPEGTAWIRDANDSIYFWKGTGFEPLPGACSTSIGVGSNEEVWIINCNPVNGGGNGIERLQEDGGFVTIGGGAAAVRVAVSPDGVAWVINDVSGVSNGTVFVAAGDRFLTVASDINAVSIGVGSGERAWITDRDNRILQKGPDNPTFSQVPGIAAKVAVSPEGIPWFIDPDGRVWALEDAGIDASATGGSANADAAADAAVEDGSTDATLE
ncbi:MAG TPA: tectonin domain-containing protein [Polyangiaceae bacterium]|jgi:hypothetical protein